MKKMMNEIIQIKFVEEYFSPDIMDIANRWYIDFNTDGILSYEKNYKSRKRENVQKVSVPYKEMKCFFSEVYKFIRSADQSMEAIDDCGHTTTIIYPFGHKEIIEGRPEKDGKELFDMFFSFMEEHGINFS